MLITSHVVVSGSVTIGENCILKVNASLVNDITVHRDVWIGPHVVVTRKVEANTVWRPAHSEVRDTIARELLGIDE